MIKKIWKVWMILSEKESRNIAGKNHFREEKKRVVSEGKWFLALFIPFSVITIMELISLFYFPTFGEYFIAGMSFIWFGFLFWMLRMACIDSWADQKIKQNLKTLHQTKISEKTVNQHADSSLLFNDESAVSEMLKEHFSCLQRETEK